MIISRGLCAVSVLFLASGSVVHASSQSEKQELLAQARARYYNLKQTGMVEVRASIKPNWEVVLTGVKPDGEVLKLLNSLHFSMLIDDASKFSLDHRSDIQPANQRAIEGVNNIFKGMNEAVSRFFATWSVFTITSPFPAAQTDYELTETAEQYRFLSKENGTEVRTITDKDFMIVEMKVSATDFQASLRPQLEKTAKGFLLTGYQANYETPSGTRKTSLNARLQYQEVNGLQLPAKVNIDTIYEGKAAQVEWLFTDYQVKVR